jgi:hypothetical protein
MGAGVGRRRWHRRAQTLCTRVPRRSLASATTDAVSDRHPLPDEISLTRDEAAQGLFALDAAMEALQSGDAYDRAERAAQVIIEKFLPDLPDL